LRTPLALIGFRPASRSCGSAAARAETPPATSMSRDATRTRRPAGGVGRFVFESDIAAESYVREPGDVNSGSRSFEVTRITPGGPPADAAAGKRVRGPGASHRGRSDESPRQRRIRGPKKRVPLPGEWAAAPLPRFAATKREGHVGPGADWVVLWVRRVLLCCAVRFQTSASSVPGPDVGSCSVAAARKISPEKMGAEPGMT
jgi:hypothetical protein